MKFSASLLASLCLCLQVASAATAAAPAAELDRNDPVYRAKLVEECGDLGVMDVPAGVPERKVRHCRDHPLSRDPDFAPDFSAGAVAPARRKAN
ncbi:hypothetical protein C7974DRAFT_419147 [Boeremia exigua]|uniref:uncharacterized protein n=1 Tax=Boeremia exigua TaxID=749465 RepID=UPI001E8E2BDB|nr:uncharacterized protein C7974DRAFT_419147 [Boeremia exigua]KAH6643520.1 hypothetical protein C7974DRAFT_419147 [Boeremia exigua]